MACWCQSCTRKTSSPGRLWSPEEVLVFKVVHEGWKLHLSRRTLQCWVCISVDSHTLGFIVYFLKNTELLCAVSSPGIAPWHHLKAFCAQPHVFVCVHVLLCLLAPVQAVSWCGMWRLTQRKQLTAPGPCLVQAGPGGERLGASRTATNRALSALRITAISSGRGPACSPTRTHTCMVCTLRETQGVECWSGVI